MVVDFDFGAGPVLLVDLDKKVFFKRSGWVVEQVVSDILGFETMIVLLIGVELEVVVKVVLEFGTVAGDFESEVAVLSGFLHFVELL